MYTNLVAASPTNIVCLVYLMTALATEIACFTLLRSATAPTSWLRLQHNKIPSTTTASCNTRTANYTQLWGSAPGHSEMKGNALVGPFKTDVTAPKFIWAWEQTRYCFFQSSQPTLPLPLSLISQQRDRKSTRLNSSHVKRSRMPSSAWKKKTKKE